MTHIWLRIFGLMTRLVSDHERALCSDYGRSWADRWSVTLVFRARGAHARLVKRRSELLRRQLPLVDEQLSRDGVIVSDDQILDECVLAKNSLLSLTGGSTPYKALLGRAPAL